MKTGKVSVRSGTWIWYLVELQSLPEWETAIRKLSFEDPAEKKNEITVDLPLDYDFEADAIPVLISHPAERKISSESGDVWTVQPIERAPVALAVSAGFEHPPHEIAFWAQERRAGKATLPHGLFLGDLTHAELLELMGSD